MKINFKLPNTRLCIIITIRDNKRTEHLMPTPPTNDMLRQRMLEKRIGYSEIRGVKSVVGDSLASQMTRV